MRPIITYCIVAIICFGITACGDDDDNLFLAADAEFQQPAPPPGFTAQVAEVNGVRLNYLLGGTGDEVVMLVHGWPQTWYEWHELMPDLARDYTVIVPDLRGGGSSERPAYGAEGYPKTLLAEDLHALVRSLNYERIRYVGHDIGGMVGYAYASLYPDEVQQFVIMDVPLPGVEPVWSAVLNQYEASWHFGFFQEPNAEEIVRGDEATFIEDFIRRLAFTPAAFPEEDIEVAVAAYTGLDRLRGGFGWYRGFEQDTEDFAAFAETRLSMPVLGLGGEASAGQLMPPLLRVVADTTQLTTFSIPEAGHWIVEEQPEIVLEQLLQFFNQ